MPPTTIPLKRVAQTQTGEGLEKNRLPKKSQTQKGIGTRQSATKLILRLLGSGHIAAPVLPFSPVTDSSFGWNVVVPHTLVKENVLPKDHKDCKKYEAQQLHEIQDKALYVVCKVNREINHELTLTTHRFTVRHKQVANLKEKHKAEADVAQRWKDKYDQECVTVGDLNKILEAAKNKVDKLGPKCEILGLDLESVMEAVESLKLKVKGLENSQEAAQQLVEVWEYGC